MLREEEPGIAARPTRPPPSASSAMMVRSWGRVLAAALSFGHIGKKRQAALRTSCPGVTKNYFREASLVTSPRRAASMVATSIFFMGIIA